MLRLDPSLQELRAGLDALIAEGTPEAEPALKAKVIELANILQPVYNVADWELLAASIREKFGLDAPTMTTLPVMAVDRRVEPFMALVEGGWFGAYLDYTKESEAPAAFHFGAAITCIAGAMGRAPLIGWQAITTYPNIYTLLVGPTGARKSTAIRLARDLVVLAAPKALNVLPDEGSPQGFAACLRRRNFESGRPLSDGLIIASELTVLLGKDQYKQDLLKWLTDWYDCPPSWARALKGESLYELIAPYVCFVGASNATWLKDLPEAAVKGGFLPRHLIFDADGKRHKKADPQFDPDVRIRLAEALMARIARVEPEMALTGGARALLVSWYEEHIAAQEEHEYDELFAAWLSRKLPHALKLACVWQIADGGSCAVLDAEWLRRAMAVVDWMDPGVRRVYRTLGITFEGAAQEAVVEKLRRCDGKASVAVIARGLRNRYKKASIVEAVNTLLLARIVTQELDAINGAVLKLVKEPGE